MERLRVLMVLRVLVLFLVLGSVQRSECVQCFARLDLVLGQCDEELGEVEEEDCCQNSQYSYQATDGVCRSCGPPVWSPWSPWSHCNVLCGAGVTQRNRKCFGIGVSECENPKVTLQTKPCNGTCCEDKGWGLWLIWSPCSVTCGGGGVRRRERVCSSPPECRSACTGPSEERDACATHTTCPVHGSWSSWSGWSQCSDSCNSDVIVPNRERGRSCSSPAPSNDTVPPGNSCPGDEIQVQNCSELPTCPVDGSWGAWSPPGPCSTSCGEGLQLSMRVCDGPAPKYGGRLCDGPSTRSSVCQSACLVDGGWGSWSPFSSCPVTCGVGLQESLRGCDNPAPKSGGRPCPGEGRRTSICQIKSHCPVDGQWSEWSQWKECKYPFGDRNIRCKMLGGSQIRDRHCRHRAHNGSMCSGNDLMERRVCYDVTGCYLKGSWDGWETWSLCSSSCEGESKRFRSRHCKPFYSNYNPTIGRQKEQATFFGNPLSDCGVTPDGKSKIQMQSCVNVPPCTEQPTHR
ncbi:properdin-like isoform X2 [Cyclopterus lumpus]|uniref:properdin-like isoform X2 n=1 Tax=Cyclopterus lumpus TaxID=8103 RepID=UPI001486ADF1|nr:properdin-like isoform X2 [Cyclopterus lumpus]